MKASILEAKEIIKKFYKMNEKKLYSNFPAVYLSGPAGIGKSQILYQIAEELNVPIVIIALSNTMDPESLAGFPVQGEGETFRINLRPSIYELIHSEKPGILFIDELGRESEELRAVLLKLISEKVLNETEINSLIVLAGNPADENYTVKEMDLALSSRLYKLDIEVRVEEVAQYFYGKIRKIERENSLEMDPLHPYRLIAKFLLDNPKYLTGLRNNYYLSPRTWEFVAVSLTENLPIAPIIGKELEREFQFYNSKKIVSFIDYIKGKIKLSLLDDFSIIKMCYDLEDYIFDHYKEVIQFINDKALPLHLAVVPLRSMVRNDEILKRFPNFLNDVNDIVKTLWRE